MDIFDVIGPIMIGPSSSAHGGRGAHCRVARRLLGAEVEWASIGLYGSFASTYQGHGTDRAIVAGLMDMGGGRHSHSRKFVPRKAGGHALRVLYDRCFARRPPQHRCDSCAGRGNASGDPGGLRGRRRDSRGTRMGSGFLLRGKTIRW